jgi:hypothetical protein
VPRSRLTRRDWIIRIVAIVIALSFLAGLVEVILSPR